VVDGRIPVGGKTHVKVTVGVKWELSMRGNTLRTAEDSWKKYMF
jgi:hypothetical protein